MGCWLVTVTRRYYVLRNNLVEKVLRLTKRPERPLVLAAIRFLRTCVGLKVREATGAQDKRS